ncbi:MAG: hypothetical protein RXN79_02750 [Candidatus Nanopusillus sp.]
MSAPAKCQGRKRAVGDILKCARVARVQREVVFESHNWFHEKSEITFYNECDEELDVICVDRRALSLNLGALFEYKYAAVLRAYGEDGTWLNLLRSADPCLEGGGPGHICFSLPAIKLRPHEYYTVQLMYEGSPLSIEEPSAVVKRYTRRSLLSAVKPYRDVPVLMWNYPPGRAPSIMPQSLYTVFRIREDWLEIDEGWARKSLEEGEGVMGKLKSKLDVIALSNRALGYRMEIPSSTEKLELEELGPVIPRPDARPAERFAALLFMWAWLLEVPYYITLKLRVNLLYRLLAVLVEILGFLTAALSLVFMSLVLWRGQQSMIGDGLLLLTTLFIIVLGNYLTLPKGGPLRYGLLGGALAAAAASVAGLAVMMLLRML